jgi:hypothetical protein
VRRVKNLVTGGKVRAAMLLAVVALLSSGCAADPSAQFFSADRPAVTPPPGNGLGAAAGITARQQGALKGPVARPDAKLTPGAIASKSNAVVCAGDRKVVKAFSPRNPVVSAIDLQAVFAAYRIPVAQQLHYGIDFLVPLQLGGGNVRANMWPMVIVSNNRGAGFHEKEVLNIRLHVLVCHGQMQLADAQKQVATDWVTLWLKYGA